MGIAGFGLSIFKEIRVKFGNTALPNTSAGMFSHMINWIVHLSYSKNKITELFGKNGLFFFDTVSENLSSTGKNLIDPSNDRLRGENDGLRDRYQK